MANTDFFEKSDGWLFLCLSRGKIKLLDILIAGDA